MLYFSYRTVALSLVLITGSSLATAKQQYPFSDQSDRHSIYIHGGQINVFNDRNRNTILGIEYRLPKFSKWGLVPSFGYMNSKAGAGYLYSDLKYTFQLSEHWGLLINTGLGFYNDSPLMDLGHTIEFKSGFEVFYQFDNQHRISLAGNHYSNSRLSDVNPGTETLSIGYTIPF